MRLLGTLRGRLFALLAALGAVTALAVGVATYVSVRKEADELFDGGTGLDGDTTGRRAAGSRRTPVAAWMSS